MPVKDENAADLDELVQKGLSPASKKFLLDLVAEYSWWVPREVYERIQVVYPKTRRARSKETRRDVVDGVRLWYNEPAIEAFWRACGKRREQVKNYFVCHIYEDSVKDPYHFTNLANLTAFPKSLQSLSEWEPVNQVLKYHSFKMYHYSGPNGIEPSKPDYEPSHWNHQSDLPSEQVDRVVRWLDQQSKTRPWFSKEAKAKIRGTVGELPQTIPTKAGSYVKGVSCPRLGEKHDYQPVERGSYLKCTKCNSTRRIYPKRSQTSPLSTASTVPRNSPDVC